MFYYTFMQKHESPKRAASRLHRVFRSALAAGTLALCAAPSAPAAPTAAAVTQANVYPDHATLAARSEVFGVFAPFGYQAPRASSPFNLFSTFSLLDLLHRQYYAPVHANYQVDIAEPQWSDDPRYAEVVINANTGEIVYDRNATEQRHIASMTKVLTVYMVFQAMEQGRITRDSVFTASEAAASQECMCYGLKVGDTMTVDQALHALLSMSYNDVAAMVAENLGGSELGFASSMTDEAYRMGAVNTVLGSASGLHDDNSTALDIARIYNRISQDYPELYAEYFSPARVDIDGRSRANCRLCDGGRNDADIGATGQKTGTTNASNRSVVAEVERNGQRFIIVTMGTPSDKNRMARVGELGRRTWAALPAIQASMIMARNTQAAPAAQAPVI